MSAQSTTPQNTTPQTTPPPAARTPGTATPGDADTTPLRPGPYLARVDQANKSALILDPTGRAVAAYAPGITRSTLPARIAPDGWALTAQPDWRISNPPEGHEHPVRHVSQDPHLTNAVVQLLLRHAAHAPGAAAQSCVREAAHAAGLLWNCLPCGTEQPTSLPCWHCRTQPPSSPHPVAGCQDQRRQDQRCPDDGSAIEQDPRAA